jgi:hypothetical protein
MLTHIPGRTENVKRCTLKLSSRKFCASKKRLPRQPEKEMPSRRKTDALRNCSWPTALRLICRVRQTTVCHKWAALPSVVQEAAYLDTIQDLRQPDIRHHQASTTAVPSRKTVSVSRVWPHTSSSSKLISQACSRTDWTMIGIDFVLTYDRTPYLSPPPQQ